MMTSILRLQYLLLMDVRVKPLIVVLFLHNFRPRPLHIRVVIPPTSLHLLAEDRLRLVTCGSSVEATDPLTGSEVINC